MDKWYLTLNYQETKEIIGEKIENIRNNFVEVGFFLKQIRDSKSFEEDGYKSIYEFAEDIYGISRSTASRWMDINDRFSEGGNSPELAAEYREYGKSQLQEMLYLTDEQLENVDSGMTVREIKEIRKPEEEEAVSILGYPLRKYIEKQDKEVRGCGTQYCFRCHRDGCELRQVECYCVETPLENKVPCTTINVVDMLREEIGSSCQFVNEDLAYHRAGDGQPVPCCRKCPNKHNCGYACSKSVAETKEQNHEELQIAEKDVCNVAQTENVIPEEKTLLDELDLSARTYNCLIRHGITTVEELQGMSDEELAKIRNFGRMNLDEVHEKLKAYCDSKEQLPGQMELHDYPGICPEKPIRATTMLTYIVEAVLDWFDIEEKAREYSGEQFIEEVKDMLFAEEVSFIFGNTKLQAEFLNNIEISKAHTGEDLDVKYTWEGKYILIGVELAEKLIII